MPAQPGGSVKPQPESEFAAALAVADQAIAGVLGDRQVWVEEATAEGTPLPWPLLTQGPGYPQLLRILATAAVDATVAAIREADGIELAADPADPGFQHVLRVVRRAVDAADAELRRRFGGPRGAHRLDGRREFINWLKAQEVEAAVRSGLPRAEALAALPISKSAAYRAMKRR